MERERQTEQFRQLVLTSALNLFTPDLYQRLFDPEYMPPLKDEESAPGGVFYPTTDDEFDQMMAALEEEEALQAQGFFNSEA